MDYSKNVMVYIFFFFVNIKARKLLNTRYFISCHNAVKLSKINNQHFFVRVRNSNLDEIL